MGVSPQRRLFPRVSRYPTESPTHRTRAPARRPGKPSRAGPQPEADRHRGMPGRCTPGRRQSRGWRRPAGLPSSGGGDAAGPSPPARLRSRGEGEKGRKGEGRQCACSPLRARVPGLTPRARSSIPAPARRGGPRTAPVAGQPGPPLAAWPQGPAWPRPPCGPPERRPTRPRSRPAPGNRFAPGRRPSAVPPDADLRRWGGSPRNPGLTPRAQIRSCLSVGNCAHTGTLHCWRRRFSPRWTSTRMFPPLWPVISAIWR